MSDKNSESGTGAATAGPQFTERELELLSYAMRSLKSGPPEVYTCLPLSHITSRYLTEVVLD